MIDLHDWTTPNGHKITRYMASYPWVVPHERQGQKLEDFPHLARWFAAIKAMPSTERAYALAAKVNTQPTVNAGSAALLFNQSAATVKAG